MSKVATIRQCTSSTIISWVYVLHRRSLLDDSTHVEDISAPFCLSADPSDSQRGGNVPRKEESEGLNEEVGGGQTQRRFHWISQMESFLDSVWILNVELSYIRSWRQ